MDITIEQIDTVVARTNATFKEAKEALEKVEGNVVEAIILIEEGRESWTDSISNKGDKMMEKLKEILRKGNVTKITVKKDGEVLMNIPITAAALGSIISVPLALVALGSAIISKCTIEVQKEDGEIIDINTLLDRNIKVEKQCDEYRDDE